MRIRAEPKGSCFLANFIPAETGERDNYERKLHQSIFYRYLRTDQLRARSVGGTCPLNGGLQRSGLHYRPDGIYIQIAGYQFLYISTYTPARGVTIGSYTYLDNAKISTHTPARGVTDHLNRGILFVLPISTHTPARGVTRSGENRQDGVRIFLLTRPRGA